MMSQKVDQIIDYASKIGGLILKVTLKKRHEWAKMQFRKNEHVIQNMIGKGHSLDEQSISDW